MSVVSSSLLGSGPSLHERGYSAGASLCLVERTATLLPRGFQVHGVAEGMSSLLLWEYGQEPTVLTVSLPRSDQMSVDRQSVPARIVAAYESDRGAWQLLVADPDLEVRELGDPRGAKLNVTNNEPDGAAYVSGEWAILRISKTSHASFIVEGEERTDQPVGPVVQPPVLLTGSMDRVFVSEYQWPFAVHTFNLVSRRWITYSPDVSTMLSAVGDRPGMWRALRVLPLDRGWLRTFADLTSDVRVLMRVDPDGRVAAFRTLEQPLAFIASLPTQHALFAVRELGISDELIRFSWAWSPSCSRDTGT